MNLDGEKSAQLYGLLKGIKHKLLLFTGSDPEDMGFDELRKIHHSIESEYEDVIDTHLIV
ncbi:MAG: hypothetical protein ACHQ6U_02495 [Thermodesulfobacteriota bacterium]